MNLSSNNSKTISKVESWIKKNLPEASSLESETLKTVEGFLILWSIFEGSICDKKENEKMVETFQRIIQNLEISSKLEESVKKSLSFYRNRYVDGQKIKPIFYNLRFRPSDLQNHVEAVLKGEKAEFGDIALALLIIAYRIRNNLFHGLKSVQDWNGQAGNISEASCILVFMIEDGIIRGTVKY